jgi:hypothetical protein
VQTAVPADPAAANPAQQDIINDLAKVISDFGNVADWQPPGTIKNAQRKLTAALHKAMEQLYRRLLATKHQRDWYENTLGGEATGYLDAPGTFASGTRMSNTDFRTAVHLQLGVAKAPGGLCDTCGGSKKKRHSIRHCFTCAGTRPARSEAHHAVVHMLHRVLKSIQASGRSTIESVGREKACAAECDRRPGGDQGTIHRTDLSLTVGGQIIWVDASGVAVSGNRTNSAGINLCDLDGPAEEEDAYLRARDADKRKKYNENYLTTENNIKVVPFCFAITGRLSEPAREFVSYLAQLRQRCGYRRRGIPVGYPQIRRQIVQLLSVTIQTHHARLYRSYALGFLRKDAPVGSAAEPAPAASE